MVTGTLLNHCQQPRMGSRIPPGDFGGGILLWAFRRCSRNTVPARLCSAPVRSTRLQLRAKLQRRQFPQTIRSCFFRRRRGSQRLRRRYQSSRRDRWSRLILGQERQDRISQALQMAFQRRRDRVQPVHRTDEVIKGLARGNRLHPQWDDRHAVAYCALNLFRDMRRRIGVQRTPAPSPGSREWRR